MTTLQRAAIIIDYQNMHLTARGMFTPQGTPTHMSLLHPLHLAHQILIARAATQTVNQPASVDVVEVFRGLPSTVHDPKSYARSLAQRAEWTRDARVNVTYRPLRYQSDSSGVPIPREKGIDVLVALKLVELAQSGTHDLLILAAHDTDLEPALDAALASIPATIGQLTIETAGWQNCKRLRPSGRQIWHTFMTQTHYLAARDLKTYL